MSLEEGREGSVVGKAVVGGFGRGKTIGFFCFSLCVQNNRLIDGLIWLIFGWLVVLVGFN